MRRFIIKTVIIHILILLLAGQPLLAADMGIDWFRDFYLSIKPVYDLSYQPIILPEVDDRGWSQFSIEAQNELLNLTNLYGSGTAADEKRNGLEVELSEVDLSLQEKPENTELTPPGIITFNPLPGLEVSADYDQNLEELKTEKKTNIRLNYQMNQRTMIRAEFGLGQKEWWDVPDISLDSGDEGDPGEGQDRGDPPGGGGDTMLREAVFNTEDTKESRVGVSYQTSDRITFTADYIDQATNNESDFSTVFGVQYNDERGQLRYSYQIDYGQPRQTVSGLELDLKEVATFNASYKLLNPDLLKDQLKESIWDFGIDVSLSDISSLSLGYQLKSEQEGIDEIGLDSDLESNIRAKLEFSF